MVFMLSVYQNLLELRDLSVGQPLDVAIHAMSLMLLMGSFVLMTAAIRQYTESIPEYWVLIVTGIGLMTLYILLNFLSGAVISDAWMLLADVYLMMGSLFIFGGMYKLWEIFAR